MTALICDCCKEECALAVPDTTLGLICEVCHEGVFNGVQILSKHGVTGVFQGTCGDNNSGKEGA